MTTALETLPTVSSDDRYRASLSLWLRRAVQAMQPMQPLERSDV